MDLRGEILLVPLSGGEGDREEMQIGELVMERSNVRYGKG